MDGHDGGERWRFNIGEHITGATGGSDGRLYLGTSDGVLVGLNAAGSESWKVALGGSDLLPTVGPGGELYTVSHEGAIFRVSPEDGRVLWEIKVGDHIDAPPVVGPDGTAYVGTAEPAGSINAVSPDGEWLWTTETAAVTVSPTLGSLYVATDDGDLYDFEEKDGSRIWRQNIGGRALAPPAIASDRSVYVLSEDGLFRFSPEGTLQWRFGDFLVGGEPLGLVLGHGDDNAYVLTEDGTPWAVDRDSILVSKEFHGPGVSWLVGGPEDILYIGGQAGLKALKVGFVEAFPVAVAAGEPLIIRWGRSEHLGGLMAELDRKLAEEIKVYSERQVEVKLEIAEEVGLSPGEIFPNLVDGGIQLATIPLAAAGNIDPIFLGVDLPGLYRDIPTAQEAALRFKEVLTGEYLQDKYNMKLLTLWPAETQLLYCRDPIASIGDLKGRSVPISGAAMSDFMSALNAESFPIPDEQIYDALKEGKIDCAVGGTIGGNNLGWPDVTSYLYDTPLGWDFQGHMVRLDVWNELGEAHQREVENVFLGIEGVLWETALGQSRMVIDCSTGNPCREGIPRRMTLVEPTEDDYRVVREVLQSKVLPEWVNRCGWQGCAGIFNATIAPVTGIEAELAPTSAPVPIGGLEPVSLFTDFGQPLSAAEWTLVGSATHDLSSGTVTLVEPLNEQVGYLFSTQPINTQRFKTAFSFEIGGGTGADGMAFVVSRIIPDEDQAREVPDEDRAREMAGLGSGGPFGWQIMDGFAIEFDTWDGNDGDMPGEHVGVNVFPPYQALAVEGIPGGSLRNNGVWDATILFDSGHVQLYLANREIGLENTQVLDYTIPGFVPFDGYIGVVGATGGSTDMHSIYYLEFDGLTATGIPTPGAPLVVLEHDFERGAAFAWSNSNTDASHTGQFTRFLGRFGNETVALNLTNLPPHDQVELSFDLYIIDSWDGSDFLNGADYFQVGYSGSIDNLLSETFIGCPDPRFGSYAATQPEFCGADVGFNPGHPDAIYRNLDDGFVFQHSATTLNINFTGSGLQGVEDESWGIDNVRVTVSTAAAVQPRSGGTLGVGLRAEHCTFDVPLLGCIPDIAIVHHVYDTLVQRDPKTREVVPMLAESWEASPDLMSWTFYLRQGVKFRHGKEFEAGDVVFTFNRLFEVGSPLASALDSITDIVAVDDYTVRFDLNRPNALLPEAMSSYQAHITPSDIDPGRFATETFGTGPFTLEEFVVGERAVLKRRGDYFLEGLPYLNALEFVYLPDPQTRAEYLKAGRIDVIYALGTEYVSTIAEHPETRVSEATSAGYMNLAMIVTEPPFDNILVRKALQAVTDREAILQAAQLGRGGIAYDHPITPDDPVFNDRCAPPEYDPDLAKRLLAEAGFPNGINLTLYTSTRGAPMVEMAMVMRERAAPADINIDVQVMPADRYFTDVWMVKPFSTVWWSGRIPDDALSIVYKSDAVWNESFYNNLRVDELIITARGEPSLESRKRIYGELQCLLIDEVPRIIPVFRPVFLGLRNDVRGVSASWDNFLYLREAWIALEPTPTLVTESIAGLPAGAVPFRGHSYLIVTESMSWPQANAYAASLGGYLATIGDDEENHFVADLAETNGFGQLFIGLTDEADEGRFVWANGEPLVYANWNFGEPNNAGPVAENYVYLGQGIGFRWNDVPGFGTPFVVEFDGLSVANSPPAGLVA